MSKFKRVAGAPRRRLKNILVLHGPNLNLLGAREPRIYGKETIQSINVRLSRMARSEGATLQVFQSNHEGAFIEVHLSNIYSREPFRRHSYFSDLAVGTICGLGSRGYDLALQFVLQESR